jgi:cbb3-type cytochrome oxidase subunit 3
VIEIKGLDTFKGVAGLLMLLGILASIGLIVVGSVLYYSPSSNAQGRKLMRMGGGTAVLTIIFIGVYAVASAVDLPQQNQAIWNLLLLILSVAVTGFLFRNYRPKD